MRISDWSSDVCSSDLDSGFDEERAGSAARLTLGPGPAGVVDDHAAQESVVAGPAQADAQVAAVGPAGGQEAHARAAGRAPELQLAAHAFRSEEHTSELQSLMRISYAVFCLKKKKDKDR